MADRPQLAYVVNSLNPGGTERLVIDMGLEFSKEFSVTVYCLDEPGSWAPELRESGVPVHCLWRQPGLDLRMPAALARHFRAQRTEIVHAHQCTPWFYAALARAMYPRPRVLLEEHGRFYPERYSLVRNCVNRSLIAPLTQQFIAVSADIAARLRRYEGLGGREIEVIYNGVRSVSRLSAEQRRAQRAEFGFADEHFVVGTVGRFDPIKNLPMLVSSLERCVTALPVLRGFLVGDGAVRVELERQIAAGPMAGRVCLTGFRQDARALVQCMDLFVLSSVSEGTSVALLEAMSAGVPVAVTDVGGNPEIVTGPEVGWVVESGDTVALAEVIARAASSPEVRAAHAQAALAQFQMRFSFSQMIARYRAIYRGLLSGGHSSPGATLPQG